MSNVNQANGLNGTQQEDVYWPSVTQGTAKISRKGKEGRVLVDRHQALLCVKLIMSEKHVA